jgi:flagellar hook protein FlgE
MNSISSIARSGLQTAQMQMHVAAHNIANAQTAGFQRQGVARQTQSGGGVSAQVTQAAQPGGDFVQDVVQQIVAMYTFQANVVTLQTEQKMLGSLLDAFA